MLRAVPSIVTATRFALRSLGGQPFPVANSGIGRGNARRAGASRCRPALQFYWRESIASTFGGGQRSLAQSINDEADQRDTDAGIGDVKSRTRIGQQNIEVNEK